MWLNTRLIASAIWILQCEPSRNHVFSVMMSIAAIASFQSSPLSLLFQYVFSSRCGGLDTSHTLQFIFVQWDLAVWTDLRHPDPAQAIFPNAEINAHCSFSEPSSYRSLPHSEHNWQPSIEDTYTIVPCRPDSSRLGESSELPLRNVTSSL